MSDDVIIRAENIGKRYTLNHQGSTGGYRKFSDTLIHAAKAPLRWFHPSSFNHQPSQEDFWALKDINFEVKRGEVLGIIGRNGAGKSTLLKILSRITEPTTGRITLNGRVASLLEVGTGFHPELTGRENIYLNGAILGMHRAEIKAKFDEIVAFAEVEKFLDTPVKRYSSGMYVRLAFAVAAHLEPEILIVDEVLAVGDNEFQKKCLGKMESVSTQEGRTVLFVSHNMGAISQLCTRGLLLRDGQVKGFGSAQEIIRDYTLTVSTGQYTDLARHFRGPMAAKLLFQSLRIVTNDGVNSSLISPTSPLRIEAEVQAMEDIPAFRTTLAIFCNGVRLFSTHDTDNSESIKAGSRFRSDFTLPAIFLRPGIYFVALGGHSAANGEWLWATDVAQFEILEEWADAYRAYDTGVINFALRGERTLLA
jgi:lipopolysaccharide transport system ATP-binding protein